MALDITIVRTTRERVYRYPIYIDSKKTVREFRHELVSTLRPHSREYEVQYWYNGVELVEPEFTLAQYGLFEKPKPLLHGASTSKYEVDAVFALVPNPSGTEMRKMLSAALVFPARVDGVVTGLPLPPLIALIAQYATKLPLKSETVIAWREVGSAGALTIAPSHAVMPPALLASELKMEAGQSWGARAAHDAARDESLVFLDAPSNHIRVMNLRTELATILTPHSEVQKNGVIVSAAPLPLKNPSGVCFDSTDNSLIISDCFNERIVRVRTTFDRDAQSTAGTHTQVSSVVAGSGKNGYVDATGEAAQFARPTQLAISSDATFVVVCDRWNKRLRRIDLRMRVVTTLAGGGAIDSKLTEPAREEGGVATVAILAEPKSVCFDRSPDVEPDTVIYFTTSYSLCRLDTKIGEVKILKFSRRIVPECVIYAAPNRLLLASEESVYLIDPTRDLLRRIAGNGAIKTKGDREMLKWSMRTPQAMALSLGTGVDAGDDRLYVSGGDNCVCVSGSILSLLDR